MIKIIVLSTLLTLCACQKIAESTSPNAAASVVVPVVKPSIATKADWQAAYQSVVQEKQKRTDADGVTEFMACFNTVATPCTLLAFGSSDVFNGTKFLTPLRSKLNRHASFRYLHSYISIQDCNLPQIIFNTRFFSKNGWIFMNNVSVLADNKKVFNHDFNQLDVKRDNESHGVEESITWLASHAEIEAFRTISTSPTVVIRITGDKGFVTLDKKAIIDIKEDALQILAVYDILMAALKEKLPPQCV